MNAKQWVLMMRPGTLLAAMVPVAIGLVLAYRQGDLNSAVAVVTLMTALLIQVFSNLTNDYYDYKKGDDFEGRLGPIRAVSAGLISVEDLKKTIAVVSLLALAGGVYLLVVGGWPILAIGCSALMFAWLYSATRFSLSRLGIADLFVLIYFGPVAVIGTYFLQLHQFEPLTLWLGVGTGLISMAVLTVNNVRDYQQDKAHKKKTIVVRMGLTGSRIYYLMLLLLPIIPLFFLPKYYWSLLYLLATGWLYVQFLRARERQFNRVLVLTGLLNVVYLVTIVLAFYA